MLKCRVDALITQLAASLLCQPRISTLFSTFLRPSSPTYPHHSIAESDDFIGVESLDASARVLLELSFHFCDLQLNMYNNMPSCTRDGDTASTANANANANANAGSGIIGEAYLRRVDARRVGLVLQCLRYRWELSSRSLGEGKMSPSSSSPAWNTFNSAAGAIAVIKEHLEPCLVAFTKDILCLTCDCLSVDLSNAVKRIVSGISSEILSLKIEFSLGAMRGCVFSIVKPRNSVDRVVIRAVGDYFQWLRAHADELIKQCQLGMVLECGCNGVNSAINRALAEKEPLEVNHNVSVRTVRRWLKGEVYRSYPHLLEVFREKYQRHLSYMLLPPILLCIYSGGLYRHTATATASSAPSGTDEGLTVHSWHDQIVTQVAKDLDREQRVRLVVRLHSSGPSVSPAMKSQNSCENIASVPMRHRVDSNDGLIEATSVLDNELLFDDGIPNYEASSLSLRLRKVLSAKLRELFTTAQSPGTETESVLVLFIELAVYYVLLSCSRSYTVGDGFLILNDLFGPDGASTCPNSPIFRPSSSSRHHGGLQGSTADEIGVFLSKNGVKVVISEEFDLIEPPTSQARDASAAPAVLSRFLVVVTTLLVFNNSDIISTPASAPGSPALVRISSLSEIATAPSIMSIYHTLRFNPDSCYHRYVSIKPLPL